MVDVPQIVRERLRAQAVASEHPDANLLSAFAERTLTEQERAQVLDHVSRCADCRQVVALSAPEVEEERRVAAAVAGRPAVVSRSWWRSPVVHWGALTAAALVVLIAVGERLRLREGRSASAPAVAKYEPAQQFPAATEAAPAPPKPKESPKPAPAAPPASAYNRAKTMGGSAGKLESVDKLATIRGVPSEKAAQSAPPPPPPPTAVLETNSAQAERALRRVPGRVGTGASGGVGRAGGVAGGMVGGAAAAPAPKSEAAVLSQDRGAMVAKRAILSPRWSVSDSGAVQRSFDGGRSWKDVAIADGVSFRAIATVGSDVWAGGAGGVLFHSADSGEHWSRVRVQANDRALSGDIVRIEFTDTADGVVSTSTGEAWTTSDAGATWRRR